MCGEKLSTTSTDIHPAGSPPRMRGKGGLAGLDSGDEGITPAYAGKRVVLKWSCRETKDHPRVCGEKTISSCRIRRNSGSPPRVRGKVQLIQPLVLCIGITPAYAGKSGVPCCSTRLSWDHPRVCGEKWPPSKAHRLGGGSPPRVRGKDRRAERTGRIPGITPAYAGKSWSRRAESRKKRDHPRVCGEKFHPASDRKLGRVQGTKRSSGPAPAAAPAGLAGSCPASPPWSYPPRITVSRPRP